MKRIQTILEKVMSVAKKQGIECGITHKEVKLAKKKYTISFVDHWDAPTLWLVNGQQSSVRYQEKKGLIEYHPDFTDLLLVLETVSKEELHALYKHDIIRFAQHEVDRVKAYENKKSERLTDWLFQAINRLQQGKYACLEINLVGNLFHVELQQGKNTYVTIYNQQVSRMLTVKQDRVLPAVIPSLLFGELIAVLYQLTAGEMDRWYREGQMTIGYAKPIKPKTEDKIKALIEKRNDLKILHRMFGDYKYQHQVSRIDKVLRHVSKISS